MAQAGVPITNTLFPPPPGYYKAYTPENVARLAELRGSDDNDAGPSSTSPSTSVPDAQPAPAELWELEELTAAQDPPRADWVLEEGRWMLFGQMYTAEPHIATAKEIGLPALVADPVSGGGEADRQALPVLLHSFLHTLLALVDVLTGTSRVPDELERMGRASQGDQYIQHLSNLAATMMVSANQLRGVQAEATLVMLMEKQLEERRAQTERLRTKSREVAAMVRRLKESSAAEAAKVSGSGARAGSELQDVERSESTGAKQSPAANGNGVVAVAGDEEGDGESDDDVAMGEA